MDIIKVRVGQNLSSDKKNKTKSNSFRKIYIVDDYDDDLDE